jgi:hypothetical protein
MTPEKSGGKISSLCKIFYSITRFRVLFIISIYIPLTLAFINVYEYELTAWSFVIDILINISLFIDIIIRFFSAYENKRLKIIDDRNVRL